MVHEWDSYKPELKSTIQFFNKDDGAVKEVIILEGYQEYKFNKIR